MRSISTDHMESTPCAEREAAPVRLSGELRNGYRPRPTTIERSREIREIAARYIAEHGLWRFSMLSLAKHLNCLLPTLCYYYKKREELINDIVLRHVETLRARTGLAMDEAEDDSPASELHAFAREYLLVGLAEQDFHRLMIGYADLAGPIDGKPFITRRELLREIVESRLTALRPRPRRKAGDRAGPEPGDVRRAQRRRRIARTIRRGEAGRLCRDGDRLAAGSGLPRLIRRPSGRRDPLRQPAIQQRREFGFRARNPASGDPARRRAAPPDGNRFPRSRRADAAAGGARGHASCARSRRGRSNDRWWSCPPRAPGAAATASRRTARDRRR